MDLLKEAVEGVKSNKENAKELLQQWKTFYDGLDEKEQKALDKAARKLFGDGFRGIERNDHQWGRI